MKLELKENMYVRTKDGYISQYKYYNTTNAYMEKLLCIPLNNGTFANIEDIVKASYNIIDILEVGDYVNGLKVTSIDKTFDGNKLIGLGTNFGFSKFDNDYKITSIVTHEQFEQMAYKVEE